MSEQNFVGDLEFGQSGEQVVLSLLIDMMPSLRNDFEEKGYDLREEDTWQKIEVKSDRWCIKTGNIAIEVWSNFDNKNPGWAQYSNGEILAYLIYDNNQPVLLDLYNFIGLKNYVYWEILQGDWFNTEPTQGEIKSALKNGNSGVRNLLLKRDSLKDYLMYAYEIESKPRIKGEVK